MNKLSCIFLCSFYCYAKPPLEHMYGFYTLFQKYCPGHEYLSPFFGMIAVECDELKNIMRYGNSKDALVQLLKKLFHINVGEEFRTTKHSPYLHFMPRTIVELLYWLESRTTVLDSLVKDKVKNKIELEATVALLKTTFKNKKSKRLLEMVTLIKQAQQEVIDNSYRPYLVHHLLLGFLYQNSLSSNQLLEYVTLISKKFNYFFNDAQVLECLTHKEYPLEEVCRVNVNNISTNMTFESLVLKIIECRNETDLLPAIPYSDIPVAYKDLQPANDCVESALREMVAVVNHLCLEKDKERMHPNVRAFLQAEKINTVTSRQKWLELTAQVPEINYKKPERYVIQPSLSNITSCLSYLLLNTIVKKIEIPTVNASHNRLMSILKEFSHDSLQFCSKKFSALDDYKNKITLGIKLTKDTQSNEHSITLHIEPKHAWISHDNISLLYKKKGQWSASDKAFKELNNQLATMKDSLLVTALKQLLVPWNNDLTKTIDKKLLFASPTNSDCLKYQLFKKCIHQKDNDIYDIASKIIETIPNDTEYYEKSIRHLAFNKG